MTAEQVMRELEALGTERTKKSYLSRGVREPLFGVATGALKPLVKRIGVDQPLADELWDTGNFDAMYLAGMIADVEAMTEADFERWIDTSYCSMLSDFVVAVTLAESDVAQELANRWIRSGDESRVSAGWACYEWLLGWRPDAYFDPAVVSELLSLAETQYRTSTERVRRAIRNYVAAVGVSYLPLHGPALEVAERLEAADEAAGTGRVSGGPAATIRKAEAAGRLGFKRRAVRC